MNIQRSQEWYLKRCGFATASAIEHILASHETASYQNYLYQKVLERIDGKSHEDKYINADMQRGIDLEPFALAAYENNQDVLADKLDFKNHESIKFMGCSPDALIGDDGLCEIKCRNKALHMKYVITGKPTKKDLDQMYFQLSCFPERKWNDFVAYNETVPIKFRIKIIRVMRDDKRIKEIEEAVKKFNNEINEIVLKL